MTSDRTAAETIAAFARSVRAGALPAEVLHEAKRSVLNLIGGAIGVAHDPVISTAAEVLAPFSGGQSATLLGRRDRLDALSAAFINSVSANLLDYDDTHLRTVIHPTAPVAPPLLALGEMRPMTGAEFLTAFALGAEIECRLGNAVTGGHYARGWHITATCGVFGSALACAWSMGATERQLVDAIGIAASSSAGIVENLPTAAKNVGVGNAARGGLVAALFAMKDFDGAPRSIEGPLGWARAMGDEANLEELLGGLGTRWELLKNTYKPYPCGIVMHSIIDACLELRARHAIDPSAIAEVTVAGDALLQARGNRTVTNERDARVSIHHSAATALLWGKAGVAEFAGSKSMSPEAIAFRAKVKPERDDSVAKGGSRVTVRMKNGATHQTTVLHAHGSIERPMSDRDLEAKVAELTTLAGTRLDAAAICQHVWSLDKSADLHATLKSTVPAS